jgi:hypothetical protein
LLPFLEQRQLYDQFRLDEPWDSEHNRRLIEKMPEIYADPDPAVRRAIGDRQRTTFVVPVGMETVFHGPAGTTFKEITDGTSQTALAVEVVPEQAVIWTKPDDWQVDFKDPLRGVKRSDTRTFFTVAQCDGSVRIIRNEIEPAEWAKLLTRAGKEIVDR